MGENIDDEVITIRLNTAANRSGGKLNSIAEDKRERTTRKGCSEAIGAGDTCAWVGQGDQPQGSCADTGCRDAAIADSVDIEAQVTTGLKAVSAPIKVWIVNAVGAAGQASNRQAIDVDGGDCLGIGAADGGAERIGGSQGGIAATGSFSGATGIDDRIAGLGDGVGLDGAAEAQGHISAGHH